MSPRGTVMLLQGRAEFIERYYETIEDLGRRGFAVVTFDWRGQGGSERLTRDGRRGHVGRFADYDADFDAVAQQIMLPDLPPPYIGLGHSTGGQILLRAVRRHSWFQGAVLSAPFLGLGRAPLPPAVVKVLAPVLTALGMGKVYAFGQGGSRSYLTRRFDGNRLTSDERRFNRSVALIDADPALGIGAPTIGWLSAALASIRKLDRQRPGRTHQTPVILVAAGRDTIVSTRCSSDFAQRHGIAVDTGGPARIAAGAKSDPKSVLGRVRHLCRAACRCGFAGLSDQGERFLLQGGRRRGQNVATIKSRAAVPVCDAAAGGFDDRDQGRDVVGLEPRIDRQVHLARCHHAEEVGVRIVAQIPQGVAQTGINQRRMGLSIQVRIGRAAARGA
jgi:lysophospholipase